MCPGSAAIAVWPRLPLKVDVPNPSCRRRDRLVELELARFRIVKKDEQSSFLLELRADDDINYGHSGFSRFDWSVTG